MKSNPLFVSRALRTLAVGATAALLLVASVPSFTVVQAQEPQGDGLVNTQVRPGGEITDTWAVNLAPGVNADAAAAQAGMVNLGQIGGLVGWYRFQVPGVVGRADNYTASLLAISGVLSAEQQITNDQYLRAPTDPQIGTQWHLQNTGQGGGTVGADANVFPAWDLGYDGTDIVVSSVDDGVRTGHNDIAPNFRFDLSHDYTDGDNNPDTGSHGQAVAGVMAASDETTCGVGAAYNADISAFNVLLNSTDANEADALSFSPLIDVYNNSWGPNDNGFVLEGPGPLTQAAFQVGITTGRGGLGSIYTWAAGNGGTSDNINADGYANDRRIIAVGASGNTGVRSSYSEPGAPMLVTAPSNGGTLGITTSSSSVPSGCSINGFGGTSSAAPLAAGVIALMLDANPALTWRDVQWVLVETADVIDAAHSDWVTNASGREFNHFYGFGRVNAEAAVTLASTWVNVPTETSYASPVMTINQAIPESTNGSTVLSSVINVPDNLIVEHVEIVVNVTHPDRGHVHINVESPNGMVSRMIFNRPDNGNNYTNWRMSSVASWGEFSAGDWTLTAWDRTVGTSNGTFTNWQIIVWGYESGVEPTATPTGGPETETPTPTNTDEPTATNTPGGPTETPGGPTDTPTDEPTATATNTETPGDELIQNGGFENLGTDGKPDVTPWVVKNSTGDKAKCNKDKDGDGIPDKIFANSGDCAFQFKNVVGEAGKIQQTLDLTGVVTSAGDTLNLSVAAQTKGGATGKVKVVFKHDDLTKTKITLDITDTADVYQSFTTSGILSFGIVTKAKINIKSADTSGKVYVDDVSLKHLPVETAPPTETPEARLDGASSQSLSGSK